ncbi:MAG: single-stranded-DNA-specific exonuclease RecJ [Candidatus Kerfeldbacteria bacterium]|nr:single-stranded-DNA-specific exonuclease RecJ [Candidatus Kerfeldbacteria bacterium]
MRFTNRQWQLAPPAPPDSAREFPELHPVLVGLVVRRGLTTQAAVDEFLHPDWSQDVHDPFRFREMERVVERLIAAVERKELIVVYGDYDADGVCASATLAETFRALGARWDVYIPYRHTEGYGLHLNAIEAIAKRGAKVIVTVDCGSSNVVEIARAAELGLDLIVTDHHHEPPERPQPYALINPWFTGETYPFQGLSAAGVAFKVVQALLQKTAYGRTFGRELPEGWEKWLLDLVTISTIADMVPLLGENRTLVSYGLTVLRKTRRLGLHALIRTARKQVERLTAEDVAFVIGPRINSAGRLNHASTAFRLLMSTEETEAAALSDDLTSTNTERQKLTKLVYDASRQQIGEQPAGPVVFAGDAAWSPGLLGLVAGKLVQHYGKPAFVFGSLNGETVASGRSIESLNIIETLAEVRSLLSRYGGHEQACGFTLKSRAGRTAFERQVSRVVARRLKGIDARPSLVIDAVLAIEDVTWELVERLEVLEPYGVGNRKPRFLARGVVVTAIERVGGDLQHLKLAVTGGDHIVRKMIGFTFGEHGERLTVGDTIDVVYEVGVHEWNGNREIELKMIDARHSHEDETPDPLQ